MGIIGSFPLERLQRVILTTYGELGGFLLLPVGVLLYPPIHSCLLFQSLFIFSNSYLLAVFLKPHMPKRLLEQINEVADHPGKRLLFLLSPRRLAECSLGPKPSDVVKKILKSNKRSKFFNRLSSIHFHFKKLLSFKVF